MTYGTPVRDPEKPPRSQVKTNMAKNLTCSDIKKVFSTIDEVYHVSNTDNRETTKLGRHLQPD